MREVPLFQRDLYEHILEVSDRKGVQAMIELIRSCSIHCGPTTGAVFQGIRTYFDNYPLHAPTKALFVACDGLAPYVSYIMEKYPELVDLTPESSISKSPQSLLSHTPHQSVSLEEILHT